MSSDPLVLGVDVGGTKVAVGAVRGARVSQLDESPTPLADADTLLYGIEATVRRVIEQVGQPAAVGVGVPSQIEYATGTVESSVNIPLTGVPLRDELGRRFGVPVFVDNDANCAALAEAQFVDDAPASALVMLTLGTGVGGGVVIGGEIFRGANGLGAELGHFTIDPEGPPCPGTCPGRGCIEAYCSGQALERDATQVALDMPGSQLASALTADGKVPGRALVAAAHEGDADALRVFDRFGAHARRGDRRIRERLRARAHRDRRRALAGGRPVPRAGRGRGRLARAAGAVEAGDGLPRPRRCQCRGDRGGRTRGAGGGTRYCAARESNR